MITDPIGDLFTRIRNAADSRNNQVVAPYSKMKEAVSRVLKKEGYLSDVAKDDGKLVLSLKLKRRRSVISGIKNVSSPGLRIYRGSSSLPRVLGGIGTVIVSTSKGIMTGHEAREKGLGGEILAKIW